MKQRDLRRRLEVLRDLDRGGKDTEHDAPVDDDLIRKTPNGFILLKQNFDWLEKPESNIDMAQIRPVSVLRETIKNIKGVKAHK